MLSENVECQPNDEGSTKFSMTEGRSCLARISRASTFFRHLAFDIRRLAALSATGSLCSARARWHWQTSRQWHPMRVSPTLQLGVNSGVRVVFASNNSGFFL